MDRLLFRKPIPLSPLAELSTDGYKPRVWWLRYGIAIGAVLVAGFFVQGFSPYQYGRIFLFLVAVTFSAWMGGLGPGLLATFLSVPLINFWALPSFADWSFGVADLVLIGVFVLAGIFVSLLEGSRRRTEELLRRSRDQFRIILQGIADGVTAQNLSGQLVYANDAAAKVTGFQTAEELLRTPIAEVLQKFRVFDADGQPFPLQQLPGRVALQEGRAGEVMLRFRVMATGEERWSVVKARPVFDTQGNVQLAINLFQDITALKQAEAALDAERERFRVTLASIGDGVIATDTEGRVQFINPAAEAITGWAEAEAVGKPVGQVFHIVNEDTRVPVENPAARALSEGVVVGLANHTVLIGRDGAEYPIDDSGAPIRSADGETIGAVLIFRDISERRKTEKALRDAHARTVQILESLGDAFYALDNDWRFTYINQKAESYWGRRREELLGKVIWEAFPQVIGTQSEHEQRRAAVEQQPVEFEIFSPVINRWLRVNVYPSPNGLSVYFHDITERRETEARLREQETLFRQVMENMRQAFYIGDPMLAHVYYANPAYEHIFGNSVESLYQDAHSWLARVHPEDRPFVEPTVNAPPEQELENEYRIVRPDGTVRWIREHVFPVRDENGVIVRGAAIAEDITERKRAETALKESEQQLRLITDAAPVFINYVDSDLRYRFVNKAFARRHERAEADILGKHLVEVMGERIFDIIQPYVEKTLAGQSVTFDATVTYPNVGVRHLLIAYVPDFDDNGKIRGFVAIINDITERVRAEEALRQSEALYRTLMEAMPQLVWSITNDGVLTYGNRLCQEYMGVTVEEINKLGWGLVIHPDDLPAVFEGLRQWMESGEPHEMEVRIRRADGVYRWFVNRVVPVMDAEGRILHWVGTSTDIHERKLAEEDRARLVLQLEQQSQRLNDLIANVPGVVWEVWGKTDPGEGKINFVSEYIVSLLGYPLESWLTTPDFHYAVLHPDDRDRYILQARDIFNSGKAGVVQFRWLAQDGREVWVASHQMPVLDEVGNPVGVRGVTIDITARKQAEERVRMVLENMPVMLIATDWAGHCVVWNQECERVTGYSAEEMLGIHNSLLVKRLYPDDAYRRQVTQQWEQTFGNYRDWELMITAKDGAARITSWSDISAQFPVPGWANWAVGVDVTARKRAEERVIRLQTMIAALSQALTPAQMAEVILKQGAEALDISGGVVVLAVDQGRMLEIAHSISYDDETIRPWKRFSIDAPVPIAETARSGAPLWIESPEKWDTLFTQISRAQTGSQAWATLPLKVEDRVLGAIGFTFSQPRDFPEDERAFMLALAQHCAQAFERARLYEAEQQARTEAEAARQRLQFLAEASALLAASLDYEETLERVARLAVETIADWCVIDILAEDGSLRRVAAAHSNPDKQDLIRQLQSRYPLLKPGQKHTALQVVRENRSWLDSAVSQTRLAMEARDDEHLRLLQTLGFKSEIVVSLNAHGKLLGAITLVLGESERRYSQRDLEVAEELGRRAATAMDNAWLYRQAQEARADAVAAAARTARLQEITSALSEVLTVEQMADVIVVKMVDAMAADSGSLALLSEDGGEIEVARAIGIPTEDLEALRRTPLSHPIPLTDAVRTGQPVWIESLEEYRAAYPQMMEGEPSKTGTQSAACLPLVVGNRAVGAIGIGFTRTRSFSAADRAFMTAIAQQSAQALERARLYEAELRARERAERAANRTARLQAVTAALSQALTTEAIADVIISQGVSALGAIAGSIYMLRDTQLELVRAVGYSQPLLDQWQRFSLDSSVPIADAVRSGQAMWLESDDERASQYPEIAKTATRRDGSWAAIPLVVNKRAIGGLGLSFAAPRRFNDEDKAFMLGLAQQCAQALERARLYEMVQRDQQRQTFLAEATAMLASSLDYELTLQSVAFLAVPIIADWCSVYVASEDGASIEQLAVAHQDPEKVARIHELQRRYPPDPDAPRGVWNVLRTGQAEFYPQVTEELLAAVARNEEHLRLLKEIGFTSAMMVPLTARGRVIGAMSFIAAESRRRYDPEGDLTLALELARRAAIAIDNSRLYHQVQQQQLLSEALRDTAVVLSSTLNLSEVLDQILDSLGRVVPHDVADIMFIDAGIARIERSKGYVEHGLADSEDEVSQLRLKVAETPNLCWIMEHKQPLAIADTQAYEGWVVVHRSHQIRSSLCAPILIEGEVIGFINVNSLTPGFFTTQGETLQAFANQAAVAIRNARLHQQAQKLAALEERQRLARELHDAVSQTLFSASVIAESLPRLWEREPEKVLPKLLQLSRLNRGALAEMRMLLLELRPAALLNSSLGDLVNQLAEAVKGRREVAITLDIQDQQPLPPDVHIALYRIIQEALNNILKHAQASEIKIYVRSKRRRIEVRISDNGRGFDVKAKPQGMGLGTMRERADAIGATLEVSSEVGKGTEVSVVWSAVSAASAS